jgi:hypothetical protein
MFSGVNSNLTLALLSEVSRCYFLKGKVECEKKEGAKRVGRGEIISLRRGKGVHRKRSLFVRVVVVGKGVFS